MTTKALAPQPVQPKIAPETMEKVLIHGDLKALTPRERVRYYDSVCQSLGLNPLTRPFDYLILNGKLQLYAKRECTEQLRQIHNVNLTIKAREAGEGCYIVTAMATLPNGRHDESIGVVTLEGLKGENRSNAMMKAETKAKRRVTLSICGLAFLDETEVDSVRGASHVDIDPQTGEMLSPDPDSPRAAAPLPAAETIARAPLAAKTAGPAVEDAVPPELQAIRARMRDRAGIERELRSLCDDLAARIGDEAARSEFARLLARHGVERWEALRSIKSARQLAGDLYALVQQAPEPDREPELFDHERETPYAE